MTTDASKKSSLSGLQKLLLGCSLGCGAIFVVLLLVAGGGAFWAFAPGQQIATEGITSDESLGVVRLGDLAADAGAKALVDRVLRQVDDINRQNQARALPENLRWIANMRQSPSMRDVQLFIPKDATVIVEPGDDDELDIVFALNFRAMVRLFKTAILLANRSEETSETYRGYELVGADSGGTFTFAGSTLLAASSREALVRALDRIEDGTAATTTIAVPDGDWDAAGNLSDPKTIADMWSDVGVVAPEDEGEPGDEEMAVAFGLDVVSADEVEAKIVLDCRDRERAALWLDALESYYEGQKVRAAEQSLRFDSETVTTGTRVESHLRLSGLEDALEDFFANLVQFETSPEP
jgi:hypothetical protein